MLNSGAEDGARNPGLRSMKVHGVVRLLFVSRSVERKRSFGSY